jgi:predicted O-methyltransferase YrrM
MLDKIKYKHDPAGAIHSLDKWVSRHGNRRYIPRDYEYKGGLETTPVFACQQVRTELTKLVGVITEQGWFNDDTAVLEIGLGYYGSTHLLWRHLFDTVMTIEKETERVNRFSRNTEKYYGKEVLNDGQSLFVLGESQSPKSLGKVYGSKHKFNMLFIDGDHSYEKALADWLLYKDLVIPGGIVVFDDVVLSQNNDHGGVARLVKDLEDKHRINYLIDSKMVGIAYYSTPRI